jgi:GntR family transcriptional regulator
MTGQISETLQRTPLPLYLQAAAILRQRIARGEWGVGERLPSMEALTEQIPVARLTIREALACLEREGIVRRRQGSGTYVARDLSGQRRYRVATDWDSLVGEISEGAQQSLEVRNPPRFPDVDAAEARLAAGYRYFKRLNIKDDIRYGFMTYHIASSVFSRNRAAFMSRPVLPVLGAMKSVRIKAARQTMHIETADPEAASLLQIDLSAPVVHARRIVIDERSIALFVGDLIYRGDYVRFDVDLMPGLPAAERKTRKETSR